MSVLLTWLVGIARIRFKFRLLFVNPIKSHISVCAVAHIAAVLIYSSFLEPPRLARRQPRHKVLADDIFLAMLWGVASMAMRMRRNYAGNARALRISTAADFREVLPRTPQRSRGTDREARRPCGGGSGLGSFASRRTQVSVINAELSNAAP